MENIRFRTIAIICCLFISAQLLMAQSGTAVIVYAEGDGFTLVREGETDFYEVDYDDILGMLLYEGDTILTEEDTFLEVQVTSNASLIKIAENTTFAFEEIGRFGGGSLNVAYGRIRAKVNKLTNNDKFQVTGSGTVAGVRGTDFGYDLTYGEDISEGESNEAITSVYCFEGAVLVGQENSDTKEVKEIIISEDQMVVTSSVKLEAPLVIYDIEEEIDQFWADNKFVYEMAVEDVLVVSDEYEPEVYYSEKIFGQKRRLEYAGTGLLLSGLLVGVGGGAAYTLLDDKGLGVGLLTAGGVSTVAGIIFLIQSSKIPNPPEGWVAPPVEPENPATSE